METYLDLSENNTVVLFIPERSITIIAYDIKRKNINKVGKKYYLNSFFVSNKICLYTMSYYPFSTHKKYLLNITEDQIYEISDRPSILLQKRKWSIK